MFYSKCLLSKKGPLGAIWVAAAFFKKLKKAQIKETDIPSSVDEILQNEINAVAYRVLAYLLLGVVRIYSKKVDYLFDDCNKLLVGIKDFVVKEKSKAPKGLVPAPSFPIALPKRFELDAFDLEILEEFHGGNVKPQEDITLRDRGWKNERMGQYSLDQFDTEEFALVCDVCSADHEKTKRGFSSHEMGIDTENATDNNVLQEETANAEAFFVSENEPPDPDKLSDNQNGDEQMKDLELEILPEEGSMEKIRDDGFNHQEFISPKKIHGIEKERFSNFQTENMEAVLRMSEIMEDTGKFLGFDRESFEVARVDHEENHAACQKAGFHDLTLSVNDEFHINTEYTLVSVTPEGPPRLKIPEASEASIPQFSIIPTPALKEGARVSRKRKCLIDGSVVMPNSFMKRSIEDSSELITRRRKVPRTALVTWRQHRLSSLSHCFLDPLIPYSSRELQLLFMQKKAEVSEPPEQVELSRKSEVLETFKAADTSEQLEVVPEVLETLIVAETSEQARIAPGTPVREPKSIVLFKSPESPFDKEMRPENSFESLHEEQSFLGKGQDFDTSLLHEMAANEDGDPQQDGWSRRSRKVAQYLEKIFIDRRKQGEEEIVNLFQICEERTKKESARLFYEILVLKTKEHVDVRQEQAYGDIFVLQAS